MNDDNAPPRKKSPRISWTRLNDDPRAKVHVSKEAPADGSISSTPQTDLDRTREGKATA
jgi:hypothetical protein